MAVEPEARMAAFVHQRIEAILTSPDAWGPPEAVELQLLLLLEMWHVAVGASQEYVDGVNDRYGPHIGEKVPGPPCTVRGLARVRGAFGGDEVRSQKLSPRAEYCEWT